MHQKMKQNDTKLNPKAPDNVILVPCSSIEAFFKYWFTFLKPFHGLSEQSIEILSGIAYQRYLLSKKIKDNDLLDSVVLSTTSRKKIEQKCDISKQHLQTVLSILRKHNIIVNNRINPKFMPNITESNEGSYFQLSVIYDLSKATADEKPIPEDKVESSRTTRKRAPRKTKE